jgi:zinc transporter ZupT
MSAFLLTGWTCLMTFGGGYVALHFEARRAFILAFAAGALITTALLDVIPGALGLLESSGSLLAHQHVMFACTLGFLAFYLLEQLAHDSREAHDLGPAHAAGVFGASGIALHSLLDGVAIGEAFRAGAGVGWVVALAVIVHKFADGVSTVSILMSTGRDARSAHVALAVVALAPLAGLAIQALIPLPIYMLAFVLGWFAGVFLYLGAAALIPAAHAASHSRWLPFATLSGVMLVYCVYLASA